MMEIDTGNSQAMNEVSSLMFFFFNWDLYMIS